LGSLRALEREQYAIPKYRYPSAGSLYPVQTYLYLKPERVAGLDGGWYYYHPVRHELVRVGGEPGLGAEAYGEINRAIYEASAFALFLVGEMGAIAPIYGEKARDFSLLEAGYMGQLLMSESGSFELGLCPIGEVEGQVVRAGLDLGAGQEVLHSLVGGPISRAQSQRWRGGESLGLGATSGRQLRDYLAERLPGYMVPSSVVVVERMPLSSNGKVDRQALARLGTARSRGEGAAVVAATAWEQRVAALVAGVLGVSEVGVGENLFDLGASSIHLVRLQRKLHEELGREVPIVELFGRPTVRALAEYLGREVEVGVELGEVNEAARRRKAERQKRLERRGIGNFNPNPDNGGEPA
jgi:SagB-type dehydrogenase family enzyme